MKALTSIFIAVLIACSLLLYRRLETETESRKALEEKIKNVSAAKAVAVQERTAPLAENVKTNQVPRAPSIGATSSSTISGTSFSGAVPAEPGKPDLRTNLRVQTAHARFLSLFRELDLTREQQSEFLAIFIDRIERMESLIEEAKARGETINNKLLAVSSKQATTEMKEAMRASLGGAVLSAFESYEDKYVARDFVGKLGGEMLFSKSSLTSEQAQGMVDIIAAASRDANGKVNLTSMNGESVISQARNILGPQQIVALRDIISSAIREQELEKRHTEELQSRKPKPTASEIK